MREINPQDTTRASAFEMWMSSPMPMVTLTKTFNITHICKISKKSGLKLNMLLCWCICKAASRVEEFYTLPIDGKLFRFDKLAVNVIVPNAKGGINSCDVPYTGNFEQFCEDYALRTNSVANSCRSIFEEDYMVVGTSAIIATELDCIVNQYTDKFLNPMVMWGKYREGWFKKTLPISFQFHHTQMDGAHAAKFLDTLQREMLTISSNGK